MILGRKPTIVVNRQFGGVGDVLTLSCVFRGLRETYPDHKLVCITSKAYMAGSLVELFQHNPFVDELQLVEPFEATTDDTKEWNRHLHGAERLEDHLLWQKADIAIDLNTVCVRIEHRDVQQFGEVRTPRYQIWCDAASVVPSTYKPAYEITGPEQKIADSWVRNNWPKDTPIIGVGLAAYDKKRSIGKGTLEAVCQALLEKGMYVTTVDAIHKLDNVSAIRGKRVKELMPLIKRMAVMVTVDSGLLHMAGTVGTPVVGLFGPTDFKMRMGQYLGSAVDSRMLMPCAPCWYDLPCTRDVNPARHFECLNKIKPALVVEETLRWVEWTRNNRQD